MSEEQKQAPRGYSRCNSDHWIPGMIWAGVDRNDWTTLSIDHFADAKYRGLLSIAALAIPSNPDLNPEYEKNRRMDFHEAAFLAAMTGDWVSRSRTYDRFGLYEEEFSTRSKVYQLAADIATNTLYGADNQENPQPNEASE
jgi:hypothetical protein